MTIFVRRIAHLTETNRELVEDENGAKAPSTGSPANCSSPSNNLYTQFEYADDPDRVVIYLSNSHSASPPPSPRPTPSPRSTSARGKSVEIAGLTEASAERHGQLAGELPSH